MNNDEDMVPAAADEDSCPGPAEIDAAPSSSSSSCLSLSSSFSSSLSLSSTNKPKNNFELKRWSSFTILGCDVELDRCEICWNNFNDHCLECQANQASTGTPTPCHVVWGVCNHAFHYHCILKWLNYRQVCPLDNTEWNFKYKRQY